VEERVVKLLVMKGKLLAPAEVVVVVIVSRSVVGMSVE
jgi:hypothetical protein